MSGRCQAKKVTEGLNCYIQGCLISRVPACPPPSLIDHFLAVIAPDLRTTVFVNELQPVALMKPKRAMKKGQLVMLDDILDVKKLELGVPVPRESAIIFISSYGWRKSLFFDFGPILQPPVERDYDLGVLLGHQHAYLLFQDQLKITERQWHCMFEQHWFPFRFLPVEVIKKMLNIASEGWQIDEILDDPKVLATIDEAIQSSEAFLSPAVLSEHRELLTHAFQRYQAKDYKSCVSILYPRIEGVLRSIHAEVGIGKASCTRVVDSATLQYEQTLGQSNLLMPSKFREYLTRVYFREWHPGDTPEHVSRHTVSHGVAPVCKFDRKAAIIGILTVLQIGLYLDVELPTPS